ncbi:hypothetical protein [Isobaculum melis]|uniref:Sensory transduction regulator n=1 Tax=Isobaculum melis TaxID=142588 RepID=A0A1H9T0W1_9LACT|nr:hypothetical protein [Isobaculum melis]SER90902.1 hypothetical protein SAMN04488559_11051 [Isobaculum melis]
MTITEAFDALLEEKGFTLIKEENEHGNVVYSGSFESPEGNKIPFGVVFQRNESPTDYQIIYRGVAYLKDYGKKAAVLELLNDLNQGEALYYKVSLHGDGEVQIHAHGRTTDDMNPLYTIMVAGSNVAQLVNERVQRFITE